MILHHIGPGEQELPRLRKALADGIQALAVTPLKNFCRHIRVYASSVRLPNAQPLSGEKRQRLIAAQQEKMNTLADEAAKREASSILAVLQRKPVVRDACRTVELSVAQLGEVDFVALPFEVNSADGERMEREISSQTDRQAVLLCYASGYEGYLPSGRPIDEESCYQDVAASLAPEARDVLFEAVMDLIK